MLTCPCDANTRVFTTNSAYRQHLKSQRHELYTLRSHVQDVEIYCTQIETHIKTEAELRQKNQILEREIDSLNEQISVLKSHLINI